MNALLGELRSSTAFQVVGEESEYNAFFAQLVQFSLTFASQTSGAVERLCEEVTLLTQGRVQLLPLSRTQQATKSTRAVFTFGECPVSYQQRDYGVLQQIPASLLPSSSSPAFPLELTLLLAQFCGLLLYQVKLFTMVQASCQEFSSSKREELTPRERAVLALLGRNHDISEIAIALVITIATARKHQQNLYRKLGVKNKRDALFVAYCQGYFFPLLD